jgi:hypothetical protein
VYWSSEWLLYLNFVLCLWIKGESERSLRNLFKTARNSGRSIIFFDGTLQISMTRTVWLYSITFTANIDNLSLEIDSIAMARGGFDEGNQSRRLLSELLMLISEQKQIQSHSRLISGAREGTEEEVTPLQLEGWNRLHVSHKPLVCAYIFYYWQMAIGMKDMVRWLSSQLLIASLI